MDREINTHRICMHMYQTWEKYKQRISMQIQSFKTYKVIIKSFLILLRQLVIVTKSIVISIITHYLISLMRKHFFKIKSETFASQFLENVEGMFPPYYMHNDVCNGSKFSTTKKGCGLKS